MLMSHIEEHACRAVGGSDYRVADRGMVNEVTPSAEGVSFAAVAAEEMFDLYHTKTGGPLNIPPFRRMQDLLMRRMRQLQQIINAQEQGRPLTRNQERQWNKISEIIREDLMDLTFRPRLFKESCAAGPLPEVGQIVRIAPPFQGEGEYRVVNIKRISPDHAPIVEYQAEPLSIDDPQLPRLVAKEMLENLDVAIRSLESYRPESQLVEWMGKAVRLSTRAPHLFRDYFAPSLEGFYNELIERNRAGEATPGTFSFVNSERVDEAGCVARPAAPLLVTAPQPHSPRFFPALPPAPATHLPQPQRANIAPRQTDPFVTASPIYLLLVLLALILKEVSNRCQASLFKRY